MVLRNFALQNVVLKERLATVGLPIIIGPSKERKGGRRPRGYFYKQEEKGFVNIMSEKREKVQERSVIHFALCDTNFFFCYWISLQVQTGRTCLLLLHV